MALSRPAGGGEAFRHPGADRGGPVDLAAARRILVVRPDNIGDVVLLTPALRALRAAAPLARLELLASPAGAAVAAMIPELDGVLVASPSWQLLAPAGPAAADAAVRGERILLDRIAAGRYDVMLVFTSFSQSPWPAAHLGLLAGVGTRVVHSREFAGAVATHWVTPPPDTTHHVDRSLHLLAAIGVPARGRTPSLRVPVAAYAQADSVLDTALAAPVGSGPDTGPDTGFTTAPGTAAARSGGRPGSARRAFALLVPGASCPSRRYPAHRFGVAAAAIAAAGLPVLVAGTAAEAALVDEVVAAAVAPDVRAPGVPAPGVRAPGVPAPGVRAPGVPAPSVRALGVRALPAVDLPVFTALVARATVALTNNSGGLHVADGVGTPVVVTYAGTEGLGDVAPRSVASELLQVPVPCSPCRQLVCPFCLECLDIAPERVAGAVLRLAARSDERHVRRDQSEERGARPNTGGADVLVPDVLVPDVPVPDVPVPDLPVPDLPEENRWPHAPAPRIA